MPQDPCFPHTFPRRVLLLVTGMSPQVVTETIYALAVQQSPAWVPTEVHIVTTAEGYKEARNGLLAPRTGGFHRLCEEYALPPIQFDESHIHRIAGSHGNALPDIREEGDSVAAQRAIAAQIGQFTADPNCSLHVSIAGGRKTMGFYAGYLLTLFGRPQDRLSHALVTEGFEGHREFYFPTRDIHVITSRDNRTLDCRDAQVHLADIPFVRLRHHLDRALQQESDLRVLVENVQRSMAEPRLIVEEDNRILCDGISIKLPPVQFALYAALARRRVQGRPGFPFPSKKCNEKLGPELVAEMQSCLLSMNLSTERSFKDGVYHENLSVNKSRIREKLSEKLGSNRAVKYLICCEADGARGNRKLYGLFNLQPHQIKILLDN